MLVLSRTKGEKIVIGNDVTVVVIGIRGDTVRLGVEAPAHVRVDRGEIYLAKQRDLEARRAAELKKT